MGTPDINQLSNLPSSERHRILRENYGVSEVASPSAEPCYFLDRLAEHFGVLSTLAISVGALSSFELRENDQFVCADICLERLRLADWKYLAPIDIAVFSAVLEKFAHLHNSLKTEVTTNDESDAIHILYFTSCFLKAMTNCSNCQLTMVDDILVPQMKKISLNEYLGQKPNALVAKQLISQLEGLIAVRKG